MTDLAVPKPRDPHQVSDPGEIQAQFETILSASPADEQAHLEQLVAAYEVLAAALK